MALDIIAVSILGEVQALLDSATQKISILQEKLNDDTSGEEEVPPISEDYRAIYPLLKNCGRFKDEKAIAHFLNLPPAARTAIFNTTAANKKITGAMCISFRKKLNEDEQ